MKLLIDTNIILDALMAREPWANEAQKIILAIAEEEVEGFITASSFTDIYYLLRKHLKDKELTKQYLLNLLSLIKILDVNNTDCEKAFDLPMNDYEDALLAFCGKRHKMDLIITRNKKHFEKSPVKAVEPEDILLQISQKQV